ncbi:organic hydroperoxide resistance protein [Rubrobacter indicoceani]|uniref:organic hydroperoxide resistance protein n=1 Tax=Rubrobacter indicoceani TaxID=2051957 RepID=UPI000E5C1974|nr:organic hydroperoxide resistance protein [Rubrobacter indicoceani]
MDILYTATATAHGGREGRVESSDGKINENLVVPEGMGGPGGDGTNPEQLFAAGYAACFEGALRLVAGKQKKDVGDASVTANVGIGPEGKSFALEVELVGSVPGVSREEAERLMQDAHEVCPYSKATRGNVEVTLSVAD